jgi:hypothetical protein
MGEAIQAYRGVTATDDFKNLEWLRSKTRHDEAQALNNARKQGANAEREKWQNLVKEQAAQIAGLQARLGKQ